jgi:hypothetical protein
LNQIIFKIWHENYSKYIEEHKYEETEIDLSTYLAFFKKMQLIYRSTELMDKEKLLFISPTKGDSNTSILENTSYKKYIKYKNKYLLAKSKFRRTLL